MPGAPEPVAGVQTHCDARQRARNDLLPPLPPFPLPVWIACSYPARHDAPAAAARTSPPRPPMILRAMLQRLYASLATGPGLNARPHHSRQRLDLLELRHFQGTDPARAIATLLNAPDKPLEFPARIPHFQPPSRPETAWTEAERVARGAHDRQARLLAKLRDIAEDAADYQHDHGEHALFIGFPFISLPPVEDRQGFRSHRILAPLLLLPVNLTVRRGPGAGLTVTAAADGADLLQPNPALLAWIEQQTGATTEDLFSDEAGEEPWREIAGVLELVARAAGLPNGPAFDASTVLQPLPRTDELPASPALLPGAALGLFPLHNPGLLRDTRWMIEREQSLPNPVHAFLSPDALAEPAERPASPPPLPAGPAAKPDAARELLVTQADPCQAAAVAHARASAALVVHGPPGTGKSQTIANIIGDHLARGERVLFVCDKRTALDVVKYRLDALGLGALCGVIHDPQRDRRDFYLGLRERLEGLAQEPVRPDPARALQQVNRRLDELHHELRACFDRLHAGDDQGSSFHQLCGQWLELRRRSGLELPEVEGLTLDLLQQHRADAEEILRRALAARWPDNPFRDRLGLAVHDWLTLTPAAIRQGLEQARTCAQAVPETAGPDESPALDPQLPLPAQAVARRALADQLEAAARRGLADVAARLAADANWTRWRQELAALENSRDALNQPLERELVLTAATPPPPAEVHRQLSALDEWAAIASSWTRFFAFGRKKAARAVLAPLALGLLPEHVERARRFLRGLKARQLWADLRARLLGTAPPGAPPADDILAAFRDGLGELLAVHESAAQPANLAARPGVLRALADLTGAAAAASDGLRRSARRAEALHALETTLAATRLFHPTALAALASDWRAGGSPGGTCQRFVEFADTLDDAVRLTDRQAGLPAPLARALGEAAARGLPWNDAEPALRAAALGRELRERLRRDEGLARIDTRRVEAAFAELTERTKEKHELVRQFILHAWQQRWRERLLAGTGTRLNSAGAALRQRLFVRGQKAMRLRQMIAVGTTPARTEESADPTPPGSVAPPAPPATDTPASAADTGDPLFDLCPVWMAGPATVAQIFPRTALFDVVVFDEASQCRLEEALPVLLRGRRVVIAGDPKQLPPTRFFEAALAESEDTDADTAEEVFAQQQAEAEDLLAAALNLNVQEAFLDVHYRSRHEGLIGFSNRAFYGGRLQPIPGHPRQHAAQAPIRLVRVDGEYRERGNEAEARRAADLVAELLAAPNPPSIGVACFNLNQRDLILDALDEKAAADPAFARRLEEARQRQGRDSFEGLFVKNLENVQGDERDHLIISTTFGPDAQGRFRRNFGALSRTGGERRLNVLITRARTAIHVLTSIPRAEYQAAEPPGQGGAVTGRHQLYAYLRYAEALENAVADRRQRNNSATTAPAAGCSLAPTTQPSPVAEALGHWCHDRQGIGSTVYWGNDGFCVDLALAHPRHPDDVTMGVLTDFTRYRKTPDPIAWEQFRSAILAGQGWELHRVWSPGLFRDAEGHLEALQRRHQELAKKGA